MILSKTPFRMSFVGGGSDMPAFYLDEAGAVLSTSIDKYMYIAVNKKFDGNIRVSYSKTEEVEYCEDIQHPLVRECLHLVGINGGIEIASMADIPSKGSGLGSSSSYTVGLLNALYAYKNSYISKEDLALQACQIELEKCGEPIGKQDQYAAAYGGLNLIKFHQNNTVSVEPVICRPTLLSTLNDSIIVFYTGRTRSASKILADQQLGMQSEKKKKVMRRMAALAYELKKELEDGSLDNFGEILHENWKLKSQLSAGITDTQIDSWYELAIKSGAKGGKLMGAGNGGFLMFYVEPHKRLEVRNALKALKEMKFNFESNGSQVVFYQPTGDFYANKM